MKRNSIAALTIISIILSLILCAVSSAQEPSRQTSTNTATPAGISTPPAPAATKTVEYSEDRPANFIFLVDVSGSIVSPRTNVKAADGSTITLFEALRDALKQIVADQRLLSPKSKVAFITFGTAITEKSDWPSNVEQETDRTTLLQKISSPAELQADKHGDTYMAGALNAALKKAQEFQRSSAECTTTFIIMLTDGWDEPPAGAEFNIATVSRQIVDKQNELKAKLGVNTWQVRVVGLQRLPDKKAGTKTAAEVAQMLGGRFLDVTKSRGGTVAQQVYAALRETIEDLKGEIALPAWSAPGGIVDFGTIKESADLFGSVPVNNKSCYVEKITGVTEVSNKMKSSDLERCAKTIVQLCSQGRLKGLPDAGQSVKPLSSIPAGAIQVRLKEPQYLVAPQDRSAPAEPEPEYMAAYRKADLVAGVSSLCPPGSYFGFVQFASTAKSPGITPFVITVPSRYVVEPEIIKASMRKQGFLFNNPGTVDLSFAAAAKVQSNYAMDFLITAQPENAQATKGATGTLDVKLINNGQPIKITVNSGNQETTKAKFSVDIPADTHPATYQGRMKITCEGPGSIAGPTSIRYQIEVLPSPWDEMGPLAMITFAVLGVVVLLGLLMMVTARR